MYKTTNKRFALISSEELYNSLTLIIKNDSLSQLKEFINSKNDTILLESLQSLGHVSAQQGLCITLLLLCLISFPPFLGFWGVFYICSALLESKFLWTTIVYAITSVVSAMFILKTIASIWRIEKADSMISVNYKLTYILYLITFTAIIVLPIVYGMNNIFNMSNYESM